MFQEIEEEDLLSYLNPCPKQKGRFINPYIKNIKRRLFDFFMWQAGKYKNETLLAAPPKGFSYPNPNEFLDQTKPSVSWINHSSFFFSYQGVNFLTDPVIYTQRCSPVSFIGPKRLHEPAISIEKLRTIDFVLISHDHYDHLDKKTILMISKLAKDVTFIVPEGVKKWFKKLNIHNVVELSWWDTAEFEILKGFKFKCTAVPSQHFSGRGLFDKNKTLWCGYALQFFEKQILQKQLYFVGDTGYNEIDFQVIGRFFGSFDLSLIPIGTYIPYSFMSPVHICPYKAVNIHQDVNSKLSIGMHWRTFKLSEEGTFQPPYDLYLAMKEANLDPLTFRVLEPGQEINW